MDIAAFLAPISDDAPSGENLEYEMVFTHMELAAQYGEERQVGDTIQEAEEPDFAELAEKAAEVLQQSHDIRAAIFLGEAVLHTDGFPAFADVTTLIRGYLEQFWETCHPQLDEDDGDATMRVNAVQGLADPERMLRSLRNAALTESRTFGRMSLRDTEIAEGRIQPPADMSTVPDGNQITAAFRDSEPEMIESAAQAVATSLADLRAIDALFGEHTPGEGPQLDAVINRLKMIGGVMARYGGTAAPADSEAEDEGAGIGGEDDAPQPDAAAAPSGGDAVNSPADVTAALDRIMAYYARSEPSSPVPILLERAKRLVNADFLTIIEDMAKEGLDEVRRIGGLKKDEYSDY